VTATITDHAVRTAVESTSRTATLSARWRRIAAGRTGMGVLYVWAVAEAMVWPLIPDSALMGMVLASPRHAPRLLAAAVAGTLTGGTVGVLLGRLGAHWHLPLVTERMRDAAHGWLATGGADGLWHQPLSGVPYKAFVQAVADLPVALGDFLWLTLQARGVRMLASAAVASMAGAVLWRVVPERHRAATHVTVVAAATVLLFSGLAAVIVHWS